MNQFVLEYPTAKKGSSPIEMASYHQVGGN
jgi:hypothetical protein